MADVVVIGGGIAGCSLAWEATRAGMDVVLLERERDLGVHTTGRSAAQYLRGYGNSVTQPLSEASDPLFDELEREWDVELRTPLPLLVIGRARFDELHELSGLAPVEPADAVARCPALRGELIAAAAVDDAARALDVAALHSGYARGYPIMRGRRIEALRRSAGGWTVELDGSETLAAPALVNAAGAWADEVAALAGVRPAGLTPLRRTLFTCPLRGFEGTECWPLVYDADGRFYFKPEPGQLLLSPAEETPAPPGDPRPDELDVARALEDVNAATTLELRHVRTAWTGLRTFAPDRSPVVGARADEPGFFWYAGQGGTGIQMAPELARLGTAVICGGTHALADAVSPDRAGL